jgi:hypothetical protein
MAGRPHGALFACAKLVVALYIVAFAALPFAHHDFLCHVRSTTHCDVCHIGTSGEDSSAHPGLPSIELIDLGRPIELATTQVSSGVSVRSPGRSPPSSVGLELS